MYAAHIKFYHIPTPHPHLTHPRACTEAADCAHHLCLTVAGMKDDGSPIEWMLSLPLYHFLKQQLEPYGEAELEVRWERDLHLGLNSVKRKASNSQRYTIIYMQVLYLWE
jgi:hypothetical protein